MYITSIMKDNRQTLHELARLWHKIRLTERGRIAPLYREICSVLKQNQTADAEKLERLYTLLAEAEKHSLAIHAETLTCDFPEDLPITEKIPEIRTALQKNQVVIVCGSTGSGKTTQLPKAALAEGFGRTGRIGCTQPRRLAATALANRFAAETNAAGQTVGYKVRFDDRTAENTVVKFMTDGILLAETRSDPLLLQYDCIILDEVHERSLNIDFLLGYLKLLLKKRRDLRIIISSATLESDRLADFFNNAPVIEVEGRLFPIEDIYLEPEEDEDLPDAVARSAELLSTFDPAGDILVFLPGEREIRSAAEMLSGRNYPHTEILPLFGRLSSSEQNRIFQKNTSSRRIILATNVAETSLTIPGIRFVIDSGLVRLSRYNPSGGIQELHVEFLSKASARQRRGRCGRLRDGVCIHLYSEQRLEDADDYTAPEIQRSSLAGVILQMESLHLPQIESFPFVDPPSAALIREGRITLEDLGAADKQHKLTGLGRELAALPVGPRIGKMVLEAKRRHILPEMLVIAAYLSIPDPRERPFEKAKEADTAQRQFDAEGSDFLSALILWREMDKVLKQSKSALRRFAQKNFLNFRRLKEWRNLTEDLAELLDYKSGIPDRVVDTDAIHQTLMSALPRQLGMFDPEKKCYIDRSGRRFQVFPGSVLARAKSPAKWILSFAVVETTRPYARCNAAVEPGWMEKAAPHLCTKIYDSVHWDEKTGFVSAREKVMAGQLLIHPGRRCHYGKINPQKSREIFIREALAAGNLHLPQVPWVRVYEENYRTLQNLELRIRRPDSVLDTDAIFRWFDSVLPPEICSADAVRKNRKSFLPEKENMVFDPADLERIRDFPDTVTQSGAKFTLRYSFNPGERDDGLTLLVPEQDLTLLSPHVTGWLVPGYLQFVLEPMLKSLPKNIRKELIPLSDCANGFLRALRNGALFTDQNFTDALCDYLAEQYGVVLSRKDFDSFEPMEFQKMKLAILSDEGKILRTVYEVPAQASGTKLAKNHRSAKSLNTSGWTEWCAGLTLPDSVSVSPDGKKLAYPALCDEGKSVGSALFLSKTEARLAHAAGLRRLARLALPQMMKYLANSLKFPHDMQLTLFLNDRNWKDNLVDYALDQSWGQDPETIRSAESFDSALEKLRDLASVKLAETVAMLEQIYAEYGKAKRHLNRLEDRDPESGTVVDASAQIDYLFRTGFLHTQEAVQEYKRYLKALTIRLERAVSDSRRDIQKGLELDKVIYQFHLAVSTADKPLEQMPQLYDFFLLLQEARISTWAPEIKTVRKVSADILKDAWSKIRL